MKIREMLYNLKWLLKCPFNAKLRKEKKDAESEARAEKNIQQFKKFVSEMAEIAKKKMQERAEREKQKLEEDFPNKAVLSSELVKEILTIQADWRAKGGPNDIDHFNLLSLVRNNVEGIPAGVNLALIISPDPSLPSYIRWGNEITRDPFESPEAGQTPTSDQ